LLGAEDAVISDELNHASIIDGIRLSKAQRYRYKNRDMADSRAQLQRADSRFRMIATDGGVFDGRQRSLRWPTYAIWRRSTVPW
jgi:7-keto-8-aminopelargonate synthetase-like enzyme